MKLLLDINLSPTWVGFLEENGFEAVHWSTTGHRHRYRGHGVGARSRLCGNHPRPRLSPILATTEAVGPSVVQVRTQDVLPDAVGSDVVRVLRDHLTALDQGAIVSIDELASRVRVLPIRKR